MFDWVFAKIHQVLTVHVIFGLFTSLVIFQSNSLDWNPYNVIQAVCSLPSIIFVYLLCARKCFTVYQGSGSKQD